MRPAGLPASEPGEGRYASGEASSTYSRSLTDPSDISVAEEVIEENQTASAWYAGPFWGGEGCAPDDRG